VIHIRTSDDVVKKRQAIISKIAQVRLKKGFSQTQLAKLTRMHRSNICRIESGRQNISIDTLIRIFDALGKSILIELIDKWDMLCYSDKQKADVIHYGLH
jgi:transcriptional regulator with XRE-family HTH domain